MLCSYSACVYVAAECQRTSIPLPEIARDCQRPETRGRCTGVYALFIVPHGMLPFASYVQRRYHRATGWNDDNRYSNLTHSAQGSPLSVSFQLYRELICSHSRFRGPTRTPFPYLKVSKQLVQHHLLSECPPVPPWLTRIHLHIIQPRHPNFCQRKIRGCCLWLQNI